MTPSSTSRFATSWWPVVVIAALTSIIIYQRWTTLHPADVAGPKLISVGDRLPGLIRLRTVDGHPFDFRWDSDPRPTIVYAVQPHCVWCARNYPSIKKVVASAKAYRMIAISVVDREVDEYVKAYPMDIPVYTIADKDSQESLKLNATPETLIVSSDGKVQRVWVGAYGGEMKKSIQATFGIELPNLDAGKTATP